MIALLPLLLAQITPVQPIVKGTGLPLQGSDEAAVMGPVNAMFAGIDSGNAETIRAQLRPDGGATVAMERPDGTRGVRHLAWDQYLAGIKADGHHYHERFTGQPAIEVDGDIAMVWGDFVVTVDGKPTTCGVDHFDLVREGGAWKVQNVTWSQRRTNCG